MFSYVSPARTTFQHLAPLTHYHLTLLPCLTSRSFFFCYHFPPGFVVWASTHCYLSCFNFFFFSFSSHFWELSRDFQVDYWCLLCAPDPQTSALASRICFCDHSRLAVACCQLRAGDHAVCVSPIASERSWSRVAACPCACAAASQSSRSRFAAEDWTRVLLHHCQTAASRTSTSAPRSSSASSAPATGSTARLAFTCALQKTLQTRSSPQVVLLLFHTALHFLLIFISSYSST